MLPVRLSTFVGREREIADLGRLLSENRLINLLGAGGCGKTRLALEAGRRVAAGRRDGAYWVDLAGVSAPGDVARAAAESLGIQEAPSRSLIDTICVALAQAETLVLLDNCEHVVEPAAELARRMIEGCPGVDVLATSRAPLDVEGEVLFRVPSLASPPQSGSDAASIASFDAVRLLVDRAKRAKPDFVLDDSNAPAVAALCRRLDGIPLALELVAARLRVRSVDEIVRGLGDRFALLSGGTRAALPRHRTLEASVAWSYDLLTDPETTLFRRLSMFPGSFDLDAASAVSEDPGGTLDLLSALVDRSLVEARQAEGGTRYRLLETIREFGVKRLAADEDELHRTRELHVRHFRDLLALSEPRLTSPEVFEHLDRLAHDHANLLVSMAWATEEGPLGDAVAIASSRYWVLRGRAGAARQTLEGALARSDLPPDTRAAATLAAARLALIQWDLPSTRTWATEALGLAEEDGEASRAAASRVMIATSALWTGSRAEAAEAIAGVREVAEGRGDDVLLAEAACVLGQIPFAEGRMADASRLFEESIGAARRSGELRAGIESLNYAFLILWVAGSDGKAEAICAEGLEVGKRSGSALADGLFSCFAAALATRRGDFAAARRWLDAADAAAAVSNHPIVYGQSRHHRGLLSRTEGDLDGANSALSETLAGAGAFGVPIAAMLSGPYIAEIACLRGDPEEASQTLGSMSGSVEAMEVLPGTVAWAEALVALERGDPDTAEACAQGSLAQALAFPARPCAIESLELIGCIWTASGKTTEAARVLGAAQAILDALGWVRPATSLPRFEAAVTKLRADLGPGAFSDEWGAGSSLDLEAAAAYVRRGWGTRRRPVTGWASLTPTELEVAGLVAEGLSNAQIAERLFVTVATVKSHLTHVYTKLNVGTRTQLAREHSRRKFV